MFTLEDLFFHADIDDVTEEDDHTELVFTLRNDRLNTHTVEGATLAECLGEAERIVKRQQAFVEIQRNGLTDQHLDAIASPGEIWNRGYYAGVRDTVELVGVETLRATSLPAEAVAAEPVTVTQNTPDDTYSFSPEDDKVGIPVTLYVPMPGRVLID